MRAYNFGMVGVTSWDFTTIKQIDKMQSYSTVQY